MHTVCYSITVPKKSALGAHLFRAEKLLILALYNL